MNDLIPLDLSPITNAYVTLKKYGPKSPEFLKACSNREVQALITGNDPRVKKYLEELQTQGPVA